MTTASTIAPPTWNDVWTRPEATPCSWSAIPAVAWMLNIGKQSAKPLVSAGVRRLKKLVLFSVRFLFTAATGQVGTNDAAVEWYVANEEAVSRRLVAAALAWRRNGPIDHDAAAALLREELVPLYIHFIDDHINRLRALGKSDLAHAFREWRRRLTQ